MAKNDSDLFDRLRQAGLRKRVAKTLSGIGDGASKQAVRVAQSAVSELRSLADEIERRLPSPSRSRAATANRGRRAQRPGSNRKSPAAPTAKTAAAARTNGARAPRGQNKAKILASLKAGPKTASEIAKETGIGTGPLAARSARWQRRGRYKKPTAATGCRSRAKRRRLPELAVGIDGTDRAKQRERHPVWRACATPRRSSHAIAQATLHARSWAIASVSEMPPVVAHWSRSRSPASGLGAPRTSRQALAGPRRPG